MSENTQNQCAGCNVPAGGVYQISEPSRIKPSMSMHVSIDDYKQDLAKWETENKQPETLRALIERFSSLPVDHTPTGWPAVQTKEITALLDHIADLEGQLEAIGAGGVESLRQSRQHNLVINEENRQLRLRNAELEARIATQHAITTAAARAGTVYVSGPMTGYADLNFPAFNAEAAKLREHGLKVTNPADHGEVPGAQWADYLRTDVAQLAACERIHLLPGWSKSKGAQLELHLAKALEMQITLAEGAEPLELAAVQEGVQPEVDLPDVEDMAHSALEECLSGGLSHFVLHKWMRSVMTKTQKALATHPTQQGLDALTDALTDCRRELQSCQSVIHLAGGFDPRYVSDAKAAIKKADAALAAQAKQGGV